MSPVWLGLSPCVGLSCPRPLPCVYRRPSPKREVPGMPALGGSVLVDELPCPWLPSCVYRRPWPKREELDVPPVGGGALVDEPLGPWPGSCVYCRPPVCPWSKLPRPCPCPLNRVVRGV